MLLAIENVGLYQVFISQSMTEPTLINLHYNEFSQGLPTINFLLI